MENDSNKYDKTTSIRETTSEKSTKDGDRDKDDKSTTFLQTTPERSNNARQIKYPSKFITTVSSIHVLTVVLFY